MLSFDALPRQFFHFYGNRYDMQSHIISVHVGEWVNKRNQPERLDVSDAESRYVSVMNFHLCLKLQLLLNLIAKLPLYFQRI